MIKFSFILSSMLLLSACGGSSDSSVSKIIPPIEIDSISTLSAENQYTITGIFSAKSSQALVYLDGTEDEVGETIPNLELGTRNYHIDSSKSYSGNASFFSDAGADNNGAYDRFIFDTPQSEIYFSYLTNIQANDYGDPAIGPQLKLGRIGMDTDSHSGAHIFGATWSLNHNTLTMYLAGSIAQFSARNTSVATTWDATKLINHWVRHEGYVKLLGVEGGKLKAAGSYRMYLETGEVVHRFRGWPVFSFNDPTIESDASYVDNLNIYQDFELAHNVGDPTEYKQFILPFFKRKGTDLGIWVDDVYINTSPERVELCDNPEWEQCTNRVLQNTTSRTSTSISFDYNLGHLNSSEDIYVYVINRDGSYNKAGILLP